jgi:hypothetical protein
MEILSVIESLLYVYRNQPQFNHVKVVTDSQYVVNTMTQGWKKNKNTDLWEYLESIVSSYFHGNVEFEWVKGHADNPHNKRCDALAVKAYTDYKASIQQEVEAEKQKEINWYGKKESILGVENVSLEFRPYEKYRVSEKDYVIIYQSMYLIDVFMCEANGVELLGCGTYPDCKRILQHYKTFVEHANTELPF